MDATSQARNARLGARKLHPAVAAAALALLLVLTPFVVRGQVVIEEEAAIEAEAEPAAPLEAGWFDYADIPHEKELSKSASAAQSLSCDHRDLSTFVPCIGSLFDLAPRCPCEGGTCPSGVEVRMEMINQITDEETFTWADGTTSPKLVPTTEMVIDGALFIVADTTYFKSTNGYGVVQFHFSDAQEVCTPGVTPEMPADADDDLISDPWEDAFGGRSLINPILACASPEPDCLDGDWDEESTGTAFDGDAITKVAEYRGVFIGGIHYRLDPRKKEVFVDYANSTHGAWAVGQAASTGIDFIPVSGISQEGLETSGNNKLSFNRELEPREWFHYIMFDDVDYSENRSYLSEITSDVNPGVLEHFVEGRVIKSSVYTAIDQSVFEPPCDTVPDCTARTLSRRHPVPGGARLSWVGRHGWWQIMLGKTTIANMYATQSIADKNSIQENVVHNFGMYLVGGLLTPGAGGGYYLFTAEFDGTGSSDLVNPLLLLNDPFGTLHIDGSSIIEMDRIRMEQVVTLHEFGHALGMKHADETGVGGVMEGLGYLPTSFNQDERAQIRLIWNPPR